MLGATLFSYIAILITLWRVREPTDRTVAYWWFLTLLPGFHFWHASFGKESLQLLLVAMYFQSPKLGWKAAWMTPLLLLRPHVALSLAFAEACAQLLSRRLTLTQVLTLALSAVIGLVAVTYLATRIAGDDWVSFSHLWASFQDYGSTWKTGNLRLSDTSSPFAIIEYSMRPYPWEIFNAMSLASCIDSVMILLFITLVFINESVRSVKPFVSTPGILAVVLFVLMAFTNPNVGTANRKKQLIPFLFILVTAQIQLEYRSRGSTVGNTP